MAGTFRAANPTPMEIDAEAREKGHYAPRLSSILQITRVYMRTKSPKGIACACTRHRRTIFETFGGEKANWREGLFSRFALVSKICSEKRKRGKTKPRFSSQIFDTVRGISRAACIIIWLNTPLRTIFKCVYLQCMCKSSPFPPSLVVSFRERSTLIKKCSKLHIRSASVIEFKQPSICRYPPFL